MKNKKMNEAINLIVHKNNMPRVVLGLDPDSKANGVSVYINDKLECLFVAGTLDLHCFIVSIRDYCSNLVCSIEDLCAISSSAFKHNRKHSQAVKNKISESVGKCKHSQYEIEVICEMLLVPVIHQRVSKTWKKGKEELNQFKRITGWSGSSNEDTRSAAYFGFLALDQNLRY